MFDSAFPTRNARHWTIMTAQGSFGLAKAEHSSFAGPLEEGCACPVCGRYSRAYLHHLCKENEMLAMRLASIHNLFFVEQLLARSREAIRQGRFSAFREDFMAQFRKSPDTSEEG